MLQIFLLFVGCAPEKLQVVHQVGQQTDQSQEQDSSSNQNSATDTAVSTGQDDSTSSESSPDDGICAGQVTGTEVGDCAVNFTLEDRNQELVSLHDFAGQVIFLDSSSFT